MVDVSQSDLFAGTQVQTLFREINERIRATADEIDCGDYLCECTDRTCSRVIRLEAGEYDAIRRFPTRFVLVAGHETLGDERIVIRDERYVVVEKLGESGALAVRLDRRARRPRSG